MDNASSANEQQQEQEQARIESKFRVLWEKQTYLNLLYLLVSFPLGIFYVVFLLFGLSSILSTTVILGAPILLLVIFVLHSMYSMLRPGERWGLLRRYPTLTPPDLRAEQAPPPRIRHNPRPY